MFAPERVGDNNNSDWLCISGICVQWHPSPRRGNGRSHSAPGWPPRQDPGIPCRVWNCYQGQDQGPWILGFLYVALVLLVTFEGCALPLHRINGKDMPFLSLSLSLFLCRSLLLSDKSKSNQHSNNPNMTRTMEEWLFATTLTISRTPNYTSG